MKSPVKILSGIIRLFMSDDEYFEFIGDTNEVYRHILTERTGFYAKNWYRLQIIKSLPSIIHEYVSRRLIMLINYIKITFRHLIKNKVF